LAGGIPHFTCVSAAGECIRDNLANEAGGLRDDSMEPRKLGRANVKCSAALPYGSF
jgi:hypothetical protein